MHMDDEGINDMMSALTTTSAITGRYATITKMVVTVVVVVVVMISEVLQRQMLASVLDDKLL